MLPKRRKADPGQPESPLEARRRAIADEEARTREKIAKCQKVIEEAPQRAEQMARARREEVIARASRTERPKAAATSLPDRFRALEANPAAPGPPKRLRSERRQGRLRFFLLLLILIGLAYWLYYTLLHS